MPTANTSGSKSSKTPRGSVAEPKSASQRKQSSPSKQTKSGFIATGPKLAKLRTTRVSFPTRRVLDPAERAKIARQRWKRAIRKVKAMLRFQIPINIPDLDDKKARKLAPTYKLMPDEEQRFKPTTVYDLVAAVVRERFAEYEYSRFTAPKFAKSAAAAINDKLKELGLPRYKYVTNVTVAQQYGQGLDVTSRCVWDTKTDSYTTVHISTPTLIVIASVHAVYFE